MAFFKIATCMLLVAAAAQARPQSFDDFNNQLDDDLQQQMFNPNPVYNYAYQVAADDQQTYIAHQESRDGEAVQGEYSYVDPLGALVTVTYTAGPDGYQEERNVQANFVQIRARPAVSAVSSISQVEQVVQQVTPAVQTVVQQSAGSSDADLVARIIAQLTPFIRDTVSTSLGGSGSSTSTTTTTVQQPAVAVRRTVVAAPQPAVAVRTVAAAPSSASATASIFGTGGPNNVRVETPDFNFAYELEK